MAKKKPAKEKTEKVSFTMHPRMLYDIVTRQAGTLTKALLEGVMNSIDAGAGLIEVHLTPERVEIIDDGQGFKSRAEIDNWFAKFGTPHTEEENKTYGTFRMGRGQMFAYGKNDWRTGKFRMQVDFKNCPEDDAGFELEECEISRQGCAIVIDFYDRLLPSDVAEIERELRRYCKYIEGVLTFNGERINVDPATEKWTHETDEAYYRLNTLQSLEVYNLGAFVKPFGKWQIGVGGVAVSKQQLKVNFARNDIQSDCPVWAVMKPFIKSHGDSENKKTASLDDAQRQRLVHQLLSGELSWPALRKKRLVTLCTGRHLELGSLFWSGSRYSHVISNAPKGSLVGDNLIADGSALVLADETLERFDCKTIGEFVDKFVAFRGARLPYTPTSFEELTKGFTEEHYIVGSKDLTPKESLWLKLMNGAIDRIKTSQSRGNRKVYIGRSDTSRGWTDGVRMIAVNREFLKEVELDFVGFSYVGRLLLHEECHGDASTAEHMHSEEFYALFHDSANCIPHFVDACICALPQATKVLGRNLTKAQLNALDMMEMAKTATDGFDAKVAAELKKRAAEEKPKRRRVTAKKKAATAKKATAKEATAKKRTVKKKKSKRSSSRSWDNDSA